jgi:hypothetical protein
MIHKPKYRSHLPVRLLSLAPAFLVFFALRSPGVTITSPDGNVVASVVTSGGNLVYSVTFHGSTAIETSPLGVVVNGADIGIGATITGNTAYSANTTFTSRHGVHPSGTDLRNGQTINVTHTATGRAYIVNVSAFNNGVAIRYEFTDTDSKNFTADNTAFTIPASSTAYYEPNVSVYEGQLTSSDIASIAAGTALGPPVTFKLTGTLGYLSLTESALANVGTFPNPYLTKVSGGTGRQLKVAYPVNVDGTTGASLSGSQKTPWNVIMLGTDLNMLVNNDIVEAIAAAPVSFTGATGMSVWDYLNPQPGGITAINAKTNSFWASQLGFAYNTIDAGWASWNGGNPWTQVADVVTYSHTRGIKVMLWKTSSELATSSQRTTFFQNLQNAGVDGVKIDFFDFGSQSAAARERIQLQKDILNGANTYNLVISFHGSSKPAGFFRTYPNLVQTEAIKGKENFPGNFSSAVIPFTRLLAGPADFTPLSLQGSYAGGRPASMEIAQVAALPGPIITIAERPDTVAQSPFASLIKTIPTMWDETRVLGQSVLGQSCVMARRKGTSWYLLILNSGTSRNWTIPLNFLSNATTYQADMIRDASTGLEHSTGLTSSSNLTITTASNGGFIARFY